MTALPGIVRGGEWAEAKHLLGTLAILAIISACRSLWLTSLAAATSLRGSQASSSNVHGEKGKNEGCSILEKHSWKFPLQVENS